MSSFLGGCVPLGGGVIVCGLAQGETAKYRCHRCGFESDDIEQFATTMCWGCFATTMCWGCMAGLSEEEDEPDIDGESRDVSLTQEPCPVCDANGACGYDSEGRPFIHAFEVCRVCGGTACGGGCEHQETLAAGGWPEDSEDYS